MEVLGKTSGSNSLDRYIDTVIYDKPTIREPTAEELEEQGFEMEQPVELFAPGRPFDPEKLKTIKVYVPPAE